MSSSSSSMSRDAATHRLAQLDTEVMRLRKDLEAMSSLSDFYAKDPTGRSKVERERAKVNRSIAALKDERTTVLAALGADVAEQGIDVDVARQQLAEVEAAIDVRSKARSGMSMLVSMFANDTTRAQGRQKAESELQEISVELTRLEQRRDSLMKIIAECEKSLANSAVGVNSAATAAAAAGSRSLGGSTSAGLQQSASAAWRLCTTDEGDDYYFNPSTDETSWELPPGVVRSQLRRWNPDAPEETTAAPAVTNAASNNNNNNNSTNSNAASLRANANRNSGEVLKSAGQWTAYWSKTEQSPYYYNEQTDETSWDCPPELK